MTDMRVETEAPVELPSCAPDTPEEALSWLGGTVEEVAEGLRAREIKGTQHNPFKCPLARYLQTWWPHGNFAGGWAALYWIKGRKSDVKAPLPVQEFERSFDAGAFPDLIQ